MRVFLGIMDIAGQMPLVAAALNEEGVHCRFHNGDVNWLDYHSENGYRKYQVPLPRSVEEYDIYDFYFATSHKPEEVKAAGKKIIWHICGSEARKLSVAQAQSPWAAVKSAESDVVERLEWMSRISPSCTIRDMELYDHVSPHFSNIYITPRLVDLTIPVVPPKKTGKPLVVHAPSHLDIKGTSAVIDQLAPLEKAGLIDFQLVYRMPHAKAMEIYRKADIIIDQLRIGTYGQFAIEAMAMGKLVVGFISEYMKLHLPLNTPVWNATGLTLALRLQQLIEERDKWPSMSHNARLFAETYHGKLAVRQLIKAYEEL